MPAKEEKNRHSLEPLHYMYKIITGDGTAKVSCESHLVSPKTRVLLSFIPTMPH